MDISLLVQICGWPLLIVISALSLILSLVAAYLIFSVKQQPLLSAFLPLASLPLIAGVISTVVRMLSSIGAHVNSNADLVIDPAFVLQMNFMPILSGLLGGIPPFLIVILGRCMLAWRASSGSAPARPKKKASRVSEDEQWSAAQADDYLDTLVRPR